MDIQYLQPCPYNPETFSSLCNGRGVTSEGDSADPQRGRYESNVSRASSKFFIVE